MAAIPVAGPSNPAMANPVAVIGGQYCVPYVVDLLVTEKLMTLRDGSFTVTDINGTVIFKVKGSVFSLHDHRVLLDSSDNPLISIRQKILTMHRRWQAFRGNSSDSKDLLFNVKKSSVFQLKTELDVFLVSNNSEEKVCDFKVKGSWTQRSCTIYAGDTNTIVAQMHRKHSVQSVLLDKDTFAVTVYPNVDYAFIVALVAILYEINKDQLGETEIIALN